MIDFVDWRFWLIRGRGWTGEFSNSAVHLVRSPIKPMMDKWSGQWRPSRAMMEDERPWPPTPRRKVVPAVVYSSIPRWIVAKLLGRALRAGEAVQIVDIVERI